MATEGGPSPSSAEDRRQSLTCTLCLDIFTQPRALIPCLHTFCTKCLENLIAHQTSSTFPCPYCRAEVTVPAGGASAFPYNFHIRHEDLQMAREGTHCLTHPEQGLHLYCTECEELACHTCAETTHRQHKTQTLDEAAIEAKAQLKRYTNLLHENVSCMTQAVVAGKTEKLSLEDKKAALKITIYKKCGTVEALANKCRDEQLASLDTSCVQMEDELNTMLSTRSNLLHYLYQLQHRLEQTLTNGNACSLVTLAKEVKESKGVAQTIKDLTSTRSTITRPVLNSLHTLDTLTDNVKDFFGTVDTMEMTQTAAKVLVEKKFMCKTESDTEVFCLCPQKRGMICVSYASCGLNNNTLCDFFGEHGEYNHSLRYTFGKSSYISLDNCSFRFYNSSDFDIRTYSKYRCHYNHTLLLDNKLKGLADILKTEETLNGSSNTESLLEFTINVGPHRAFDVDSSELFFAVVEEPQEQGHQRKVKLYTKHKPDAIDTYTPPSTPFNPADVCFCTLGGKEMLMIADEAGDSIHVVHVYAGRLTFFCHLAPGCPLLVQPTALNIDPSGRLWVACRGGAILTMTFPPSFLISII